MLPRTLSGLLEKAVKGFPAVLVTGPRQSGKTTLLRSHFDATHRYVSLEAPHVRERALADPVGFLGDHPPPVILDEIQHAPALLSYLQVAIDEDRRPGRWLLSGSQSFPLLQGTSESLAGRVAILTLLPLSWSEIQHRARAEDSIEIVLRELLEARPAARIQCQVFLEKNHHASATTRLGIADTPPQGPAGVASGGQGRVRTDPSILRRHCSAR